MYDVIIKGASVLDGMGSEPYFADIALENGKIKKIGENLSGAKQILNAEGLTVSPGWIDSHSHSDGQFVSCPDMKEKVEQGITFSIAGQCGNSKFPLNNGERIEKMSEFLERVSAVAQGSSAGMLVGFNTVRSAVMGRENRDPSPAELEKMKDLVRDAMRGGAIGMSYGVYYVPACYAKTDELVALAKVVAEEGGILTAHIRNESDTLVESVEEFLHIAKESGCRAVISHHKCAFERNWGKVKKTIALIDEAVADGYDIYLDVYPYIASSTSMMARFCPGQFHPAGTKNAVELLYNEKICNDIKVWGREIWGEDLSSSLVSSCPGYPEYQGKTVSEIAKMRGQTDEYETAFDIIKITNGRAQGSFFTMREEDVEYVISHPRAMICTDSGVAGKTSVYHPRLRGSFPRALGRYAREKGIVSMPEMIRKMTSLPAHVYGLKSKGKVAEGMDADLCIFDAEKIIDKADFVNFSQNNEGLHYVIVAGNTVLENGEYNGTRSGKICLKNKDLI